MLENWLRKLQCAIVFTRITLLFPLKVNGRVCLSAGSETVELRNKIVALRCQWCTIDIVHRRTGQSPVAEHFSGDGHSQADMAIMVIDQIQSHDPCLRKIRESRLIRTPSPQEGTSGLILCETCLNTISKPHGYRAPLTSQGYDTIPRTDQLTNYYMYMYGLYKSCVNHL